MSKGDGSCDRLILTCLKVLNRRRNRPLFGIIKDSPDFPFPVLYEDKGRYADKR